MTTNNKELRDKLYNNVLCVSIGVNPINENLVFFDEKYPEQYKKIEEKLDEIIKECIGRAMTYKDIHRGNYRALEDDKRHTLEVTKRSIQALINQQIKGVLNELEGIDVSETCVPECSDEQHSYHRGTYDAQEKLESTIQALIKQYSKDYAVKELEGNK